MKTIPAARGILAFVLRAFCIGVVCTVSMAAQADSIPLAGQWRFELDRADAGINERWFERSLDQRIKLPGALQNQGFGDDIRADTKWTGETGLDLWLNGPQYARYRQPGNIKVPFFLQPEKHYIGRGVVSARCGNAGGLARQTRGVEPGAASLGDACLAGRQGDWQQCESLHAPRVRSRHWPRPGQTHAHHPRG